MKAVRAERPELSGAGRGIKSSLSKSRLKISSMLKNLNADTALRLFPANSTKMAGTFSGDFAHVLLAGC